MYFRRLYILSSTISAALPFPVKFRKQRYVKNYLEKDFWIIYSCKILRVRDCAVQLCQSHFEKKMTLQMISLTSQRPSMIHKTETEFYFADNHHPRWSWTRTFHLRPRSNESVISKLHLISEGSWWHPHCLKIFVANTVSSEWFFTILNFFTNFLIPNYVLEET